MKKSMLRGILVSFAIALSAAWNTLPAQDLEPLEMPTVNEDSVMKHIVELSSERYTGRLAGSAGYDEAVKYVSRVLRGYGAEVSLQGFTLECNEVENCKFNTYIPGTKEKRVYTLGKEFCCAGMTGRGYVDAELVFCGFGSANSQLDEFAGVDVQGKVVVLLSGLPEWRVESGDHTSESLLREKARVAESHGAIGMIVVNLSTSCLPNAPQSRVYCGELPHLPTFPMLHATLDCGRELLEGEKMALDSAVSRINRDRTACSFAIKKKVIIDVNARYTPRARTANVVGMLKGCDKRLSKEFIVVAASLDHAGIQGETCLFPGADINASGVAAVLETARLLSQQEYRPRRSVLFVLFSGSEQQFLGSRQFISSFAKLGKIEAMVNLQNIGSGDSIVVLGGASYPSLYKMAKSHDEYGMIYTGNPEAELRGDARAFDAVGIPSIVYTSLNGMHNNHVSSDIWENIDRRLLRMTTQSAVETVREVADGYYQGRRIKSRRR